ncbi:ABC transporter permease [Nocardiopsis sp. NPDC101807]|uniref:ABC transporter permease n=1 Tax=Nocardiopsis sp. NPDC101807 TaxID=3364339 RepID=UPI0038265390
MTSPVQALRTVRLGAVIARADFAAFYTWKTWLLGWLIRLVFQVLFYTLIGVLVSDPDFTRHIVIGAAVVTCVTETMLATASTCWDRYQGTLGSLVASPVEPGAFFFGRSLQWPFSAMATTSIALLAVPPFFDVRWALWQIPVLVGIVFLTSLSTYCMTLLIASLTLVHDQARNVIGSMAGLSVIAICGAMVPVTFWPLPVQWVAQALPVTHGLAAVRLVEAGAPAGGVASSVAVMVGAALVWLALAFLSFRMVFARARTGYGALS